MTKTLKRLSYLVGALCLAVVVVIGWVQLAERGSMRTAEQIGEAPFAIVLGASVKKDGTPSDALLDRIVTGVELYRDGKVHKLLMTGDDGAFHTDEVEAMKRIAIAQGVPEEDVLVDGNGYRTYESCKRAHDVFNVTQAIVVTQRFHLGRALYLCKRLGVDATGISSDRRTYKDIEFFWLRDLLASFKAWWDVNIWHPESPVKNEVLSN